jgi:hypothetical protein
MLAVDGTEDATLVLVTRPWHAPEREQPVRMSNW